MGIHLCCSRWVISFARCVGRRVKTSFRFVDACIHTWALKPDARMGKLQAKKSPRWGSGLKFLAGAELT
jgi:hypothetical protein